MAVLLFLAAPCFAQSSSLFQRDLPPSSTRPLTVERGSWTYIPVPPPHEIRKHDLITIRVDELSRMKSEGTVQRRKTGTHNSILKDWVMLKGLSLKPAPMADGDPTISAETTQTLRTQGDMEIKESLGFTVTAEVADIRPNGNLVLEAHKQIRVNNENWDYSLIGECRREDVGPDNMVLSRNLYNLNLTKVDRGHIRDSYKRGWLVRWIDQFSPW